MFDQCLYFNITSISRLLDKEWTAAFKQFGLTPSQAFMLRAVIAQPGSLQSELAVELIISRPTATRLFDSLQAKKLINRRSSNLDGREQLIYPTMKAMAMSDKLNLASRKVAEKIKSFYGNNNFSEVVKLLQLIREILK